MVCRTLSLGLYRGFAPGAVACLVVGVGACSGGSPHEFIAVQGDAGRSGVLGPVAPSGAGASALAASGAGGIGGLLVPASCIQVTSDDPVFVDQIFDRTRPARRELYSWTSDEQAAALRRDQVLFTESERAGLGPAYAFTVLESLADNAAPEQRQLASALVERFAKGRYAWPEPWATRMGWPGESYGGNLLRIVLRPEAWLVVIQNGQLTVVDLDNQPVTTANALLHPERLGAILYNKDGFENGPVCDGSFTGGNNGYREFIVGNLAMVEEWSLATQAIRDRLSANIEQLSRFLLAIRSCPGKTNPDAWNLSVACGWLESSSAEYTEVSAYELSLAIPSENYFPVPERIAAMIDTLESDLFDPNPLRVLPGQP